MALAGQILNGDNLGWPPPLLSSCPEYIHVANQVQLRIQFWCLYRKRQLSNWHLHQWKIFSWEPKENHRVSPYTYRRTDTHFAHFSSSPFSSLINPSKLAERKP